MRYFLGPKGVKRNSSNVLILVFFQSCSFFESFQSFCDSDFFVLFAFSQPPVKTCCLPQNPMLYINSLIETASYMEFWVNLPLLGKPMSYGWFVGYMSCSHCIPSSGWLYQVVSCDIHYSSTKNVFKLHIIHCISSPKKHLIQGMTHIQLGRTWFIYGYLYHTYDITRHNHISTMPGTLGCSSK